MDDGRAMQLALAQAQRAAECGEVPVGAVVLDDRGQLLAVGHNRTVTDHDPTAHAEIVALRRAAAQAGNYRLPGARVFVTLEPCAMCLGAMLHARVTEIVYGAPDPKTGACGSVIDLAREARLNHHARVRGGVLADACGGLLRAFFAQKRQNARRPAAECDPFLSSNQTRTTMPTPVQNDETAAPEAPALHAHEMHHTQESPSGIYLISPSGAVPDPAALDRAIARLRALGYRVAQDRAARAVHQRFAGSDRQRLTAIRRALRQRHPIVMATRGGYGLSRLLPAIDWRAVADSGKRFVGQSDFTAFSLALLAQTGAQSLAGPTAIFDFGGTAVDDLTQALFQEVLSGALEVLSFESPDADPVDARGILWGGNLAMVASLVGTPYLPNISGGILFLEDVSEHPFRIERMLTQLWHAGVLERQHAIVLGQFTQYRLAAHDNGYDLAAVIQWLRKTVKVPVVPGLPYGHVRMKATLPVGAHVGIATEGGMAYLLLQEHHTA